MYAYCVRSLLLLALCGCRAAPLADFASEPLDELHVRSPLAVPASMSVDERDPLTADVRVGDSSIWSLRLQSPGAEKLWFVRVTVAAHRPFSEGTGRLQADDGRGTILRFQGLTRFQVQVCDPEGGVLGESFTDPIATEILREGFVRACEFGRSVRHLPEAEAYGRLFDLPPAEQRPVAISVLAMTSLPTLVLNVPALEPLLAEAVRRPSLLSIATNWSSGITVSFEHPRARPWHQPTTLPTTAAYVLPLDVQAFGERALEASMVVVGSEQPIHICVGITSIAATRPDDRDVRLQMQLQAVGRLQPAERERVVRAERASPVAAAR